MLKVVEVIALLAGTVVVGTNSEVAWTGHAFSRRGVFPARTVTSSNGPPFPGVDNVLSAGSARGAGIDEAASFSKSASTLQHMPINPSNWAGALKKSGISNGAASFRTITVIL